VVERADEKRTSLAPTDSFDKLLRAAAHVSNNVAAPARSPLSTGSTLLGGRLRVLRRIGAGGMGLVYEAHDARRRGAVALKTLSHIDPAGLYQLKNEFRALADVSHPNLVRLHELFAEGEHWFFTMELVNGEDFDWWVRPRDFAREPGSDPYTLVETRLRAALPQLVAAILAIHAAGKLHRDLKPRNVLVTADGRVVVLDFGLVVDPEPGGVGETLQGCGVSGTAAYMSPEQAAGMHATAASDFYALGVMMFEALTGTLPFQGRPLDMLVDKQRSDAPRLRASQPQLPADLAALCDELLAREPRRRPDGRALHEQFGLSDSFVVGRSSRDAVSGRSRQHHNTPHDGEVLLGRERELSQLTAAHRVTLAGQPLVAFVAGESGMGKSALVTQFLSELSKSSNVMVLAGRCYERESVPFKGIDSLVDALSRFLRKLPDAEAQALMPREVYALARVFPVLGRVQAVAQAPSKDIVDPQELRRRAYAAFSELLGRIRDRQPLVLYIDDAQWLDADGMGLLGYILGQYEPAAALLILSHRSEGAAEHRQLSRVYEHAQNNPRWQRLELALGPLPDAAAQELATRLLGALAAEHPVRAAEVAAESMGNPFFVAELARQVLASGGEGLMTLHEAVLAHVRGLAAEARLLLEVLAVAGRPLGLALALDAAGASHECVDVLHAERLLRSSTSGEGRSVECYHDKVREHVVQALAPERQRALHASLLAVLRERSDADPEHLALHALGAGDREAAASYAVQAADAASAALAFEQAALLYGRALELGEYDADARRDLGIKLGEALANAGRGADAGRAYLDAAQGASEQHTLDLKRRAAEQLLISGHVAAGKALLGEVLRGLGLRLPNGRASAVWALARERLQLRVRGLAFRARQDAPPAALLRELDVLWSAARGLAGVDMLTGAALSSRYARHALDSGLLEHAARALGSEVWFASTAKGLAAKARADELIERAEALALASGRAEAGAWVLLNRGLSTWMQGDFRACQADCALVLETLGEQCTNVAFEVCTAQVFGQFSSGMLGEFAHCAELAVLIDDAWRRGDLRAAILLTSSSTFARLVRGDAAGVQRHLERARSHWQRSRDYGWLDLNLLCAELAHALYTADFARGSERLRSEWSALERSLLLQNPMRQGLMLGLRASLMLGAARLGDHAASGLRTIAHADARVLIRSRLPLLAAVGRGISAGIAVDRGEIDGPVACLRSAIAAFDAASGFVPTCQALRRRLGQLLGGAAGETLVADAEAALLHMGAVDLEATTRLFAFGLPPKPA
jgi:serine/threonine protein kinase